MPGQLAQSGRKGAARLRGGWLPGGHDVRWRGARGVERRGDPRGIARGFLALYPWIAILFRRLLGEDAMKIKIRNSKTKKAKKTGFRTRQKSASGRKVNKRQRRRHGSF